MNPETLTAKADLQAWESPVLTALSATLDTASTTGSGSDGGAQTSPP